MLLVAEYRDLPQFPGSDRPPNTKDLYGQVPWYRTSGAVSAMLVVGLCLPIFVMIVCIIVLSGDVYYNRVRKDGTLARWSWLNKAAAILILCLQAAWFVYYTTHRQ
jgi:hypothetical protein